MRPVYAQCPHCEYPVVVSAVEALLPRRCRQCHGEYTPGAPPGASPNTTSREAIVQEHQRVSLRARVRQQRRSGAFVQPLVSRP